MGTLFALAKALFRNLNWCSLTGALVGAIAGFFFSLFQLQNPSLILIPSEILIIGILLGFVGWLFVLLVVGMWLHYGVRSISLQAFLNSMLTAIFTVYINNLIQIPAVAVIVGMIVGIIIGYLLCLLCRRYEHNRRGVSHG